MTFNEKNLFGQGAGAIPPKVQEYIGRVKSGETIESFGEIPQSWKTMIEENTETPIEKQKSIDSLKEEILKTYETPENKETNDRLEKLTQMEFAKWLQDNKARLEQITKEGKSMSGKVVQLKPFGNSLKYYDLLTLRPEFRQQAISEISAEIIQPGFEEGREYYKKTRALEDLYKNSDSNPDWLEFHFGNTQNTESDGMRRKGYITLDSGSLKEFEDKIPQIVQDLNRSLSGKYNGSFKLTQKLINLVNRFDNFVIHGANEQEVDIALDIISSVLEKNGVKNKIAQKGKDGFDKKGKKTSHTKLLEEKIENGEL